MRTSTSPGPICGTGTVSVLISLGARYTAACIVWGKLSDISTSLAKALVLDHLSQFLRKAADGNVASLPKLHRLLPRPRPQRGVKRKRCGKKLTVFAGES